MPLDKIIWLPTQPLESLAVDLSPLRYAIKTLVVSAQASADVRGGVLRLRASAKIPFKSSFVYDCDVDLGRAGAFQFLRFRESHGEGTRVGVAGADALVIDGEQRVAVPAGVKSVVTLAQSLYALHGAGAFDRAYLGLLVGRHPHLVRFDSLGSGRYKIAALGMKHDDVVPEDPSSLEWSRAHGAEILVRDGWIDEIKVTIPLVGAVTIRRS